MKDFQNKASELLIAALGAIGDEIARVTNNCRPYPQYPMGNTGDIFICDTFTAEAYDWKNEFDEEEEERARQINFKWRDLEVSWYKWCGRGTYTNRQIEPKEIAEILDECLVALREWEKEHED